MSYQDIGFDQFLNPVSAPSSNQDQGIDPLAFDSFVDQVSGNKVQGGIISSPNGRIVIDLETGVLKINDGIENLIELGVLADGSIGLLVKDGKGNPLLKISENEKLIQSANKHFQVDFSNERILARDDAGIARVLIGKGDF
jgi:hypothetical protein